MLYIHSNLLVQILYFFRITILFASYLFIDVISYLLIFFNVSVYVFEHSFNRCFKILAW